VFGLGLLERRRPEKRKTVEVRGWPATGEERERNENDLTVAGDAAAAQVEARGES
jgi:hypothetical protein